jgi:hypothetical protein
MVGIVQPTGLDYKNETAENAIRFIDSQLRLIADSLAGLRKSLKMFRQANKLIDLSAEGSSIKTRP